MMEGLRDWSRDKEGEDKGREQEKPLGGRIGI